MLKVVIGIGLLFLCGLLQGVWTDRWGFPEKQAAEAAARLEFVPMTIGDWQGKDIANPKDFERRRRRLRASPLRQPEDRPGRRPADRLRPTAVDRHPSAGRLLSGTPASNLSRHPARRTYGSADFFQADFVKTEAGQSTFLRIFWSWSADGRWLAPESPRVTFARQPFMYKMYVIHAPSKGDTPLEGEPAVDFIEVLLPQVNKALFEGNAPG